MKHLTNLEYRRLLQCIGELYEHDDLHSLKQRLPAIVARLVPADLILFNDFNLERRDAPAIYAAYPEKTEIHVDQQTCDVIYEEHPCIRHITKTKCVESLKVTDFMSQRQFRQTRLYSDAFRSLGVEYNMGFQVLEPELPEITSVSLVRLRPTSDFSESDRLKLNLFREHAGRAYIHATQMAAWRAQATVASEALAATRQAIITVNANGSVAFCADMAREYLARYFGDKARKNNSLPDKLSDWMRQQELSDGNSGRVPRPRKPYVNERDGMRLAVHFLSGGGNGRRLLLLEEQSLALSAEPLQTQLGLTARRAEVLLWIAQGKTSEEIAIILDLSISTVRKHTERIFEKLGVETRTAAARCAMDAMKGP